MPAAELRFRAMGSGCHVVVVGGGRRHTTLARRRIVELEHLWSRFLEDSEVSTLNRSPQLPVPVSADTRLLVRCAIDGWRRTSGRFDPTVLPAVLATGYVASLDDPDPAPAPVSGSPRPSSGCEGIEVDDAAGTVLLGSGTGFDPGGIGKGLAADLTVAALLEAGVLGALVSIGGDLRVSGAPPSGDAWVVGVEDPFARDREIARMAILDGGIATSSLRHGRRVVDGRAALHVIDPDRGAPADDGPAAVTVAASTGWVAEVYAKAALLAADPTDLLDSQGLSGLVVTESGRLRPTARLEVFV